MTAIAYLVKDKDKLYGRATAGSWQGLVPVEAKQEPVIHHWTGPKRTIAHWRQVLAFFEWSQDHFKSEALVHWVVNEAAGLWSPLVLPQRSWGMSVKVLEDHPNYIPAFERTEVKGEVMGTDHHHCSASAFQSGTDHSDEKTKEGLHITVGHVGSASYSLHARASFRGLMTDVSLAEWFEVPEQYRNLPEVIQDSVLRHLLTLGQATHEPGVDFPQWWAENYIRKTGITTTHGSYGRQRGQSYGGHWNSSGSGSQLSGNHGSSSTLNWYQDGIQRSLLAFMRETVMVDETTKARTPMQPKELIAFLEKLQTRYGVEQLFQIAEEQRADLEEIIEAARILEAEELGGGLDDPLDTPLEAPLDTTDPTVVDVVHDNGFRDESGWGGKSWD